MVRSYKWFLFTFPGVSGGIDRSESCDVYLQTVRVAALSLDRFRFYVIR
ncbi:hypothetical protein SAMN02745225_01315 [Ferrithrix thermotolerans DSM 19514]|uniref:REJ domain-containing protein n=1 Tax=Ferrithrix thermotolerans DSM 19514 TaxID=1121881 RepID=A0A1M4VGR5_9ACTN|nr:hypothetical protein SAMN02745225_01315 [Ferrithrix thermotolerans DSM 19514]